jgi:hypothetical protein
MDFGWVLTPMYAAGVGVVVVAAFSFGRKDARAYVPRWPLAWFGLLALACAGVALLNGMTVPTWPAWVPTQSLGRAAGVSFLVAALGLTSLGSRAWGRADALRAENPLSLDEAVEALRLGLASGWGTYRGRLAASQQVTSPGGVVCAFYEAELRGVSEDGSKGPLLSVERGYAPRVTLCGARVEVGVEFSPKLLLAPVRVRRCGQRPGASCVLLTEARPEEAALSYERVGKPGEECLVVGELCEDAEGTYVLRGREGGPAMVVLGNVGAGTGAVLARRAWSLFTAAGALTVAAAWVFAG